MTNYECPQCNSNKIGDFDSFFMCLSCGHKEHLIDYRCAPPPNPFNHLTEELAEYNKRLTALEQKPPITKIILHTDKKKKAKDVL